LFRQQDNSNDRSALFQRIILMLDKSLSPQQVQLLFRLFGSRPLTP
jgi:hypothetical protein